MPTTQAAVAIRNVLFATDFSEESAHAIDYVRSLRQGYDAQFCVLHVVDLFPFSLSDSPAAVEKAAELRRQAEARIRDFMLVHRFDNRNFRPVVLAGEIGEAVDSFVTENTIDLILLGSRGDLGVERLFLGSTAEEIFRTAHSPVMTVGPRAGAPPKIGRFHHVLFATDFSEHSRTALPWLNKLLAQDQEAKITLAHFVHHDTSSGTEGPHRTARLECELAELLPVSLRPRIAAAVVEPGSPGRSITSLAERCGADLIVLGVRYGGAFLRAATHGYASVTNEVIGKAPCPVLTIRRSGG
jgi:nucleotide-binding universal stress UspA family protein